MPRLTADGRAAALAPNSEVEWWMLVTIPHASFSEPIRVTDSPEPVVSRGHTYSNFPFEYTFPGDDPEQPGKMSFTVLDPNGEISARLRGIRPAPKIFVEVVSSINPDLVERGPYTVTMSNRDAGDGSVTCEFGVRRQLDLVAGRRITPGSVPGIFA